MKALAWLFLVLGLTGASWIDPHATAREASTLYADGKFADAAAKYREALIDDPDSPLLHYNAGLASYRDGKYEDAVSALGAVPASDATPARTARAAYATGNAKYRLGAAAEAGKPQDAIELYAEALVAYRRAMGADPADEDVKFNHELVEQKIADLKKKLEEQRKQQEQKQQEQQQQDQEKQEKQEQQPQQDQQQGQEQQQEEQQQAGEQQQEEAPQPQEQEQAGAQDDAGEEPSDQQPQPGRGEAVAGEETDGEEMSRREAQAILDGQRDQEVRPDEIIRRLDHGRVAEPREDW